MEHCDISVWSFRPAYQNSSKAIHPTMGSFNNPPSRFFPCAFFQFLCFFSPRSYMQGETKLFSKFLNFIANISCIKTEMLFLLFRGSWFLYLNVFYCWSGKLYVMTVSAINCNGKRNPFCVSEHAALCTTLGSVDGTWTGFFFPPNGAFAMAPSMESHRQSIPLSLS